MISEATLTDVFNKIAENRLDESLITQLRTEFASLHFTYCSDDDICEFKPTMSHHAFNLYLIDGREHCLALTTDSNIATGIVVAEIYPDE